MSELKIRQCGHSGIGDWPTIGQPVAKWKVYRKRAARLGTVGRLPFFVFFLIVVETERVEQMSGD